MAGKNAVPAMIHKHDRARAMWLDGATYQAIADELGYSNKSAAYKAVLAAGRRDPDVHRPERVNIEDERLEWCLAEAVKIYRRRHYVVAGKDGDVVLDPATGEPLDDDGVKLEALKLIKVLSESRRRLRGLDAPTRKLVEVVPADVVEAEIRRLEAEMEATQPTRPS